MPTEEKAGRAQNASRAREEKLQKIARVTRSSRFRLCSPKIRTKLRLFCNLVGAGNDKRPETLSHRYLTIKQLQEKHLDKYIACFVLEYVMSVIKD